MFDLVYFQGPNVKVIHGLVTHLQGPDQDVVRLEVAEDDVLPVQVGQTCRDLIGYPEGEHVTQRHVPGPDACVRDCFRSRGERRREKKELVKTPNMYLK